MSDMTEVGGTSDDYLLLHGLLSCLAAKVYSGIPVEGDRRTPPRDEALLDMLRKVFRRRHPSLDVSDDRALGSAIEDLAISYRDKAQPEGRT